MFVKQKSRFSQSYIKRQSPELCAICLQEPREGLILLDSFISHQVKTYCPAVSLGTYFENPLKVSNLTYSCYKLGNWGPWQGWELTKVTIVKLWQGQKQKPSHCSLYQLPLCLPKVEFQIYLMGNICDLEKSHIDKEGIYTNNQSKLYVWHTRSMCYV